jgi:hypothetical protein
LKKWDGGGHGRDLGVSTLFLNFNVPPFCMHFLHAIRFISLTHLTIAWFHFVKILHDIC